MTTNSLYQKIADVSKAIGALSADKTHQQGYAYISADKILERAGSEMANVGLVIIPALVDESTITVEYTDNYGKVKTRFDCRVDFEMKIADSDGNTDTMVWFGRGSDYATPDKAMYKAITSGHKYFLMKLFNVGIENEDGEHETEPPAKQAPAKVSNGKPAPARPQAKQSQAKANNGKPADTYVPLTDDEVVIYESSVTDWMANMILLISRYDNSEPIKQVLKKFGYSGIPKDAAKRLEMYRVVRDYAAARDAEEGKTKQEPLFEDVDELTGGAFDLAE